jgi:predicted nucleotidyltransferase component of viral defense system
MKTQTIDTPESTHIALMQLVAKNLNDLPIVLKGGTALLLCYGLDRFSEDLDFDANKKLNITNRVADILSRHTEKHTIKISKDTDTVQRLKIHYSKNGLERFLKIETSFRDPFQNEDTAIIDGIKTYQIKNLIDQKVNAMIGRTKARDLYDVDFLLRTYRESFTESTIKKLSETVADVNELEGRFYPAFKDDYILNESELDHLIIRIAMNI